MDAYPDNQEAKLLKAQAFRILGWKNPISGARNWYLTDARVLEGKLDPKLFSQLAGEKERIMSTPMDILLSLARYNIVPKKSANMNMTLGIKLNDTGQGYRLEIRKAVLEFQKAFPATYDVAITTDERTLKQVIAGIITLDDAIKLGKLKVDGGVDKLKQFVGALDTGLQAQPGAPEPS